MTDTFTYDRPGFEERLARLCGESTYRMPVEGRATTSRPIPAAHLLAAALAYGRRHNDPTDIGPDVAYDIVTQGSGHAVKCCRVLAEAMRQDRGRMARRCRPWLRIVAWAAYANVTTGAAPGPLWPREMGESDFITLVEAARRILWALADDAIVRAERAHCAKAA